MLTSILTAIATVAMSWTAAQDAPAGSRDTLEGIWTGAVSAPQGPMEVGMELKLRADGELDCRLRMPIMHVYGVDLGPLAKHADGTYSLQPFDMTLTLSDDRLTGTFAPAKLPIELTRGGTLSPEPPAPAYPAAPQARWSRSLGSPTWASPVVSDGLVYVGTSDGSFHAASAADGSELWKWKGAHRIDGRAVLNDVSVYFVDGRIELVCLDRANGQERWRAPLHDEKLAGAPVPDNPTFNRRTATPLLLDGAVYAGSSDGALYCIDAATGKQLWRDEAGSPIFSGVAQLSAEVLSFGCMDGSVVMLDRRTHAEIRRIKTGGGVVTTPVAAGGKVIVGSRDYMLYGFELESGALAWSFSYGFSWIESTPRQGGGVLYVGASDFRRVTALQPADGKALWSTDVRGLAWGSPLVTADAVFIGTVAQNIPGTVIHHTGGIMALDRRSGAVKWHLALPDPPQGAFGGYAGSLAQAGDLLIAAGFDGVLTAYPTK